MKKRSVFLLVLFTLIGISARVNAGHILLTTPGDCQMLGMSSNGRYVCGVEIEGARSFLWDLHTNEFTWLSTNSDISYAFAVSDNGIVAGSYGNTTVTANGAKVLSGGYWKEGKWYSLETIDGAPVSNPQKGTAPNAISDDGQYIAGGAYDSKGVMVPCLWKNGFIERIYDKPVAKNPGKAYDVTNDGSKVCGWVEDENNRAVSLWDPEFNKLAENDGFSIYHAANKFSENGKYIACTAYDTYSIFIYDTEAKTKTSIPLINENAGTFFATWVGDDKTMIWTEDGVASIHKESIGSMYLDKYLSEYENVDLGGLGLLQCIGMSTKDGQIKVVAGTSTGNTGYVILLDKDTEFPQPSSNSATQMIGSTAVKIQWGKPYLDVPNFKGYNVYKNDTKLNAEPIRENIFFDKTPKSVGDVCNYKVTAVYKDNAESENSAESVVNIINPLSYTSPITALGGRPSGYNDILLQWVKPIVADGLLHWNKGKAIEDFGANAPGVFYYGVKFGKDVLSCYPDDMTISGIEITPMNGPSELTAILKVGDKEVYRGVITDKLILRESNKVEIKTDVTIGSILKDMADDKQLFLIIKVEQEGAVYVAGVDPTIQNKGYGDLVSQDGQTWRSLEDLTGGVFNGNWCLGLVLNSTASAKKNLAGYNVYRDGEKVEFTRSNLQNTKYNFTDTNLGETEYKYAVEAVYTAEGETYTSIKSETVVIKLDNNEEPCTPPSNIAAYKTGTEELNDIEVVWDSPVADETYDFSYTDWNYGMPITLTGGQGMNFFASIRFEQEQMSLYEGFEISDLTFYPVGDVDRFTLHVFEDGEEVYTQDIPKYTLNKKNTIPLTNTVKINPNASLTVVMEAAGLKAGGRAFAVDKQPPFAGYGDLYGTDGVQYASMWDANSTVGNWLIGLNVTNTTVNAERASGNPQIRYNVYMNDVKMTATPTTDNRYVITGNTLGTKHLINVAAIYQNCDEAFSEPVEIKESTSVNELEDGINVYPNPSSNKINIDGEFISASLFDVAGKHILTFEGTNSVDVSQFRAGIYMLNIKTERGIVSKRIAINK